MNARIFSLNDDAKKISAARLLEARANAGFSSATSAAKHFGWVIPTYGAHENGTNGFSPAAAQKYATAFNVNWRWLMLLSENMAPDREDATDAAPAAIEVPRRELPIYEAAQGGTGHLIVSSDPSEYMEAPPLVRGIKGAYGIRISGDSMAPEFKNGSVAFVNSQRNPQIGKAHIFYDHDPKTGEAQAIIKTLVGFTDTKWKVEQSNPAKTFTLNKVDWPVCHYVAADYK